MAVPSDSARQLHDKLETIAVHYKNDDAPFFKLPSPIDFTTTNPLSRYHRRQLDIVECELVVTNGSSSAMRASVLDAHMGRRSTSSSNSSEDIGARVGTTCAHATDKVPQIKVEEADRLGGYR